MKCMGGLSESFAIMQIKEREKKDHSNLDQILNKNIENNLI